MDRSRRAARETRPRGTRTGTASAPSRAQRRSLQGYVDAGGIALGAFANGRFVGVVSAKPSKNTVRFYLSRGYELTAPALPELYEEEPEDVHLRKLL